MFKKAVWKILAVIFLCVSPVQAAQNVQSTENTSIELFFNGKTEYIARFKIKDGWHIYWSNPGELGRPTTVSVNNEKGSLKILNQSAPQIVKAYDVMDEYVYKGAAYFYLELKQAEELKFSFVECSEVCKPQEIIFDLKNTEPESPKHWRELKAELQSILPQKIKAKALKGEKQIKLQLPKYSSLNFLPAQEGKVAAQSVEISQNKGQTTISWQSENETSEPLSQALIMTPEKIYAVEIDYENAPDLSLLYVLGLAFLGGLILNAMPCVFPILSLKIFSLLKNRQEPKRFGRAFSYIAGVLLCFMLLTTILVFIKNQGEAIGWGFQLQSPWFVGIMALIFGVLFLFITDILHFPNFNTDKTYKLSGLNSFCTGFFAVLIASPCTGPFMGAAIGYAFMRTNTEIYAVFTALALGYALPYALIEMFPAVLEKVLPKPGKWMQKVKYVLSVPLLLTFLWLLSLLATQLKLSETEPEADLIWQPYDEQQILEDAANGERVFIDFTADWCLTCKFNEKVLINTAKFKRFVAEKKVKLYRADLTEDNDIYTAALNAYGRDGIPVYIYYVDGKYEILPLFFSVGRLK